MAEGYLLNKLELFARYGVDTMAELMAAMYRAEGERFFAGFRGAFSGALFDKAKALWLVYTNHTGDKAVFYSLNGDHFAAGSQVNYVLDACRELGWPLTLDEQAAYQMLTFGFMESDGTYAREVRRLLGGTYLRIQKGQAQVCRYFRLESIRNGSPVRRKRRSSTPWTGSSAGLWSRNTGKTRNTA